MRALVFAVVLVLGAGAAQAQHRDPKVPPATPVPQRLAPHAMWPADVCGGYFVSVGRERECCQLCVMGDDPGSLETDHFYFVGGLDGVTGSRVMDILVAAADDTKGSDAKAEPKKDDTSLSSTSTTSASSASSASSAASAGQPRRRAPPLQGLSGLASPQFGRQNR